jgi:hypothetical protein
MMFTMHLFPIAASYGIVHTTTNAKLREALLQAHEIYLSRFREQDQLVKLGDYIIWRIERESVAHELRERFCQLVIPSGFDSHEIRYGMLLRGVSDVRKATFGRDLSFGMSQAGGDSKLGLKLGFMALGTSFTRQVLKMDPTAPDLSPDERERYQTSLGYASALLAHGFFNVTDVFKAMGA